MGGARFEKNFDFEVRYLGKQGLEKWFLCQFSQPDTPISSEYFKYNDNLSLIDAFSYAVPTFSDEAIDIFKEALANTLEKNVWSPEINSSFFKDISSILSILPPQHSLPLPALEKFVEQLDRISKSSNIRDLKNYADAFGNFLQYANRVAIQMSEEGTPWMGDTAHIKDDLIKSVLSLRPIFHSAAKTLSNQTEADRQRGLNIAYPMLLGLTIMNKAWEHKDQSELKEQLMPFFKIIEEHSKSHKYYHPTNVPEIILRHDYCPEDQDKPRIFGLHTQSIRAWGPYL